MDVVFHVLGYFVVEDMFLWNNPCPFQLLEECVICLYHLRILATFHGFNEDGLAVNFHHQHDIFVALLQLRRNWPVWLENMVLHTLYVSV